MEPTTTGSTLCVDEFRIAHELGLSIHTVRQDRVGARRIPFFKIGTSVRYNVARVREALAALEVGGPVPRRRGGR